MVEIYTNAVFLENMRQNEFSDNIKIKNVIGGRFVPETHIWFSFFIWYSTNAKSNVSKLVERSKVYTIKNGSNMIKTYKNSTKDSETNNILPFCLNYR